MSQGPIRAPKSGSQRVADMVVDPADFFVPAPQDGGTTMQGRVSKDLKYLVASLIASRETSFMTESDYTRAACHHFFSTMIEPKRGGRFEADRRRLNEYVAGMQRKAVLLDFDRFANSAEHLIVRLWAIEGKDEAADHYEGMLREAKEIGESFYRFAKKWATTNPRLKEVRNYVKARKAEEEDDAR